ncbi:MAG: VOC family protein [Cyanobacteria bacterium P01_C01_bin.120]
MPKLFQPDILMFSYSAALITIATPNLNELVKFYEALLQLPPQVWLPDTYAEFAIAQLKLGIFQPQISNQREFAQPAGAAMSLCLEVMDLAAAIAHLTRLGFPPPHPIITASHGREVYAYDPDGNRLILHQGRDDGPAESLNQG